VCYCKLPVELPLVQSSRLRDAVLTALSSEALQTWESFLRAVADTFQPPEAFSTLRLRGKSCLFLRVSRFLVDLSSQQRGKRSVVYPSFTYERRFIYGPWNLGVCTALVQSGQEAEVGRCAVSGHYFSFDVFKCLKKSHSK